MTTDRKDDKPSVRAQVRAWIASAIRDQDQVEIPALVTRAKEVFGHSRPFTRQFFEEFFDDVMYELVQHQVATTRRLIPVGAGGISREGIQEKVRRSVFRNWLEHVDDRNMSVMKMTREHLLVAAGERETRGLYELKLARTWRKLADGLVSEQRVEEVYTEADVERIFESITE